MKVYIILIIISILSCKYQINRSTKNVKYFKTFDLFKLDGVLDVDRHDKEYVKVTYFNNIPFNIEFFYSKRTVKLVLQDSFITNDRPVYIYTTSNLLGGKPGRFRVYSFHYIKNCYQLFINKSDTIYIKNFDEIDAEYGHYNYNVSIYYKSEKEIYAQNILDNVSSQTAYNKKDDYSKWVNFRSTVKPYSREFNTFPPK